MNPKYKKILFTLSILLLTLLGTWIRLYHIEFGLPHSFHADEPEIAELAIKYTYEIRNIIKSNDYYKLIPVSFVYGTFPAYLFTIAVMMFSKTANLLNIAFSKEDLYIFMRSFNAILSMGIVFFSIALYKKLFNNRTGILATAFLLLFNWKLIVHAHYLNADILLVLLMTLCFYIAFLYFKNDLDNKHVVILGLIYGLAVGTKITALLSLPTFLYLFLAKKDYRGLFGFLFLIFIGFSISNPFSIILAKDFVYRILIMQIKEAGMVFDSVDSNPLKYVLALAYMSNPIILIISAYGYIKTYKSADKRFHLFTLANVFIYLIFYSLNPRRVDRWLLPILPITLLYSAEGIHLIIKTLGKKQGLALTLAIFSIYTYYPILLLIEFQRNTPKSASYLWARDNIPETSKKLAITEEGLDPLNKLDFIKVKRFAVYESELAQYALPENPLEYEYVFIASKPMMNFKKKEVIEKYSFYSQAWEKFEETLMDETKFKLVEEFTLPKPNLVELSDVFIYQNISYR